MATGILAAEVPQQINSGGGAAEEGWTADAGWTSSGTQGSSISSAVIAHAGDVPQAVYQSRRWGSTLNYHLDIPDGTYSVRLHFAELYWTSAGHRSFNVSLEGRQVLTNYDIWAVANGKDIAVVETFSNIVVSGNDGLQIEGVASLGVAQFNGVEVWTPQPGILVSTSAVSVPEGGTAAFGVSLDEAPAGVCTVRVARISGDEDLTVSGGATRLFDSSDYLTPKTVVLSAAEDADADNGIADFQCSAPGHVSAYLSAMEEENDVQEKINCGGGAASEEWAADAGWTSSGTQGSSISSAAIAHAGDVPQAVYQSRRWGSTLNYTLDIPDGTYNVRLHFAELYWTSAGHRSFDVSIEGQPVLSNFDIWPAAGGRNIAVTRTVEDVVVTDGLQIEGAATVGVAQFNGVEVFSSSGLHLGDVAVRIGNPLLARYPVSEDARPRSIWDLHTFNDRLYLAHGDYWENRGPVDIWTYSGDGSNFIKEYTVDEEMVWDYFEYDNKLLIPGVDWTGPNWDHGNVTINDPRRPASPGWVTRQSLTNVRHSMDIALFQSNLYTSITRPDDTGRTLVSTDMGQTWATLLNQYSSFVVFDDFMLMSGNMDYAYDGQTLHPVAPDLIVSSMDPGRKARYKDGVLYSRFARYRLEKSPLYFLSASQITNSGTADEIAAFTNDKVRDIVVRDEVCYVMTAEAIEGSSEYRGKISASTDLTNWPVASRFIVPGIPLSLEVMSNMFYVGLGSLYDGENWDTLFGPEAGSIWQITPKPEINHLDPLAAAGVDLDINVVPGFDFTIQASPSLEVPLWTTLAVTNTDSDVYSFSDLDATNAPIRYYRIFH